MYLCMKKIRTQLLSLDVYGDFLANLFQSQPFLPPESKSEATLTVSVICRLLSLLKFNRVPARPPIHRLRKREDWTLW
jgi:hypothetical protein